MRFLLLAFLLVFANADTISVFDRDSKQLVFSIKPDRYKTYLAENFRVYECDPRISEKSKPEGAQRDFSGNFCGMTLFVKLDVKPGHYTVSGSGLSFDPSAVLINGSRAAGSVEGGSFEVYHDGALEYISFRVPVKGRYRLEPFSPFTNEPISPDPAFWPKIPYSKMTGLLDVEIAGANNSVKGVRVAFEDCNKVGILGKRPLRLKKKVSFEIRKEYFARSSDLASGFNQGGVFDFSFSIPVFAKCAANISDPCWTIGLPAVPTEHALSVDAALDTPFYYALTLANNNSFDVELVDDIDKKETFSLGSMAINSKGAVAGAVDKASKEAKEIRIKAGDIRKLSVFNPVVGELLLMLFMGLLTFLLVRGVA